MSADPIDIDRLIAELDQIAAEAGTGPEDLVEPAPATPTGLTSSADWQLADLLWFEGDDFIRRAYRKVLGREADAQGLDLYRRHLNRGRSRSALVAHLLLSPEARARGAPLTPWPGLSRLAPLPHRVRSLLLEIRGRYLDRRLTPAPGALFAEVRSWLQAAQHSQGERLRVLEAGTQQLEDQLGRQGQRIDEEAKRIGEEAKRIEGTQEKIAGQGGRIARLEREHQDLQIQRYRLQALFHGLQRWLRTQAPEDLAGTLETLAPGEALDSYYAAFEEAFRGDPERLKITLEQDYLEYLRASGAGAEDRPVLDLGCGPGDWIELLGERGLVAIGVESNPLFAERCRARGLEVREGDALAFLRECPDEGHGAVTALHFIEHLPFPSLLEMFAQAWRVLRPKGLLICETPNPENLLVGSHTFYHDPTHRNPITPSAAEFLARYTGFAGIRILRLHPYPADARVPGDDPLTERVNGHLCGPQDFALIAEKP